MAMPHNISKKAPNELLEGTHNRNLDKGATLIKEHEKLLRKTIWENIQNPDDAEDIFQETTLKILEHFHKGKPVKTPKAWMIQIARNECVNFYRQMEKHTNRNVGLAAFISRGAFGGGVSIPDEQHQIGRCARDLGYNCGDGVHLCRCSEIAD